MFNAGNKFLVGKAKPLNLPGFFFTLNVEVARMVTDVDMTSEVVIRVQSIYVTGDATKHRKDGVIKNVCRQSQHKTWH